MAETKKIECQNCGASSVFKLSNNEYKCNYCQTNFVVNDDTPQQNIFINKKPTVVVSPAKTKLVLVMVVLGIIISFSAGIFAFLGNSTKNSTTTSSFFDMGNWQKPSQQNAFILKNTSSEFIALIDKYQTNKLDSAKYTISLINPKTKKIELSKIIISDTWKNLTFNSAPDFYFLNDLIYCISKDSGVIAFDPNSLKQTLFSTSLPLIFKELESGISSARVEYNTPVIKIKNNLGIDYFYNCTTKKLLTEKEFRYNDRVKTEQTKVFFTGNENPFLILATKLCDSLDTEFKIYISDTSLIRKINLKKLKFNNIKSAQLISSKIYFKPQFFARYKNGIILAYKDNLAKNTNIKIQHINKEGNLIWENISPEINKYLKDENDIENCNSFMVGNSLFININSYPKKFMHIDALTGKIVWAFDLTDLK
jgi:hypothetical protein